jgi:hypothetical protein
MTSRKPARNMLKLITEIILRKPCILLVLTALISHEAWSTEHPVKACYWLNPCTTGIKYSLLKILRLEVETCQVIVIARTYEVRDERMQNRNCYYVQCNRSDVVKIAFCNRHHNAKADRHCCLSVTTAESWFLHRYHVHNDKPGVVRTWLAWTDSLSIHAKKIKTHHVTFEVMNSMWSHKRDFRMLDQWIRCSTICIYINFHLYIQYKWAG